ncbi:MAG TPA: succinate dehydrogenase assembly factor 2 [Casimicrobiaceae bacterium]|nr:succinate dehydrogenase assembly factor 2 [Casimicrobiaceae bacterium]
MIDAARLRRIRWRCRRGMLENDLVLSRFLDARGDTLTEGDIAKLDALLHMTDNELWDFVCGRMVPADPALASFVSELSPRVKKGEDAGGDEGG